MNAVHTFTALQYLLQNTVTVSVVRKYKYTTTQLHKYTNTQYSILQALQLQIVGNTQVHTASKGTQTHKYTNIQIHKHTIQYFGSLAVAYASMQIVGAGTQHEAQ